MAWAAGQGVAGGIYARGTDLVVGTYNWLDLTARGRQEDWAQPPGRGDSPLMGWLRHHDRYGI